MESSNDILMSDSFNELRPLEIKMSTSSTFSGSCMISLGNTIAKCLANLPKISTKKASTEYGQFTLELTSNYLFHTPKYLETLKSHIIETFERHILLQNYPSQIIEAYIIVSNDDGGLLPALIMGMCLSLIDCGIQVYDVISACSVCIFKDQDGNLVTGLDFNKTELSYYQSKDPDLTVVNLGYCCNLRNVAFLESKGNYSAEHIGKALEVAEVACNLISGELFKILKENHAWRCENSNFALQTEYIQPDVDLNK
uniref:3' exonuclease, exosome component, putative n=1 Tax=Theileria annulata TaxID=5874 RepID=A0A3B0MHK5_THEAN